mmetsp:Transcript_9903/g.31815  ORF Transcript_9903/g.31815 Transcript_9903/m.31815 type:complete len:258 (-) Transcript_9903:2034-2807(-)
MRRTGGARTRRVAARGAVRRLKSRTSREKKALRNRKVGSGGDWLRLEGLLFADEAIDDFVEGGGGAHDGLGEDVVDPVVAAEVGGVAGAGLELGDDGGLVLLESAGDRGVDVGDGEVVLLVGKRSGPVLGEVVVGAAVVELADLALGRLVVGEDHPGGLVECLSDEGGAGVVGLVGEVLDGDGEGEELAERVPPEVVLLLELLDVLGRRAAGAGLEEAAAGEERDDGEHLGRGAELEDGEEVGEVVAEDVARDGYGV